MTPDGLITSEFDDAAIIDPVGPAGSGDRSAAVARERDRDVDDDLDDDLDDEDFDDEDFDDAFDARAGDDEDDDDLIDLELVVLDLAGTVAVGGARGSAEGLRPVPGADALMRRLRALGVRVALTASFPRETRDPLLSDLGWRDAADVVLGPDDAARLAPFPDLPLTALLRTGAESVEGMVVVGDSADDIAAGVAAGAGLVVGVLTGADDEQTLLDAGADAVVASVADLPELLGLDDPEGPGIR